MIDANTLELIMESFYAGLAVGSIGCGFGVHLLWRRWAKNHNGESC